MSGHLGGGRRHWAGIESVAARRQRGEAHFVPDRRVTADRQSVAELEREPIAPDENPHYLVGVVFGEVRHPERPTRTSAYAMYVDCGADRGLEIGLEVRAAPEAKNGYRLADGETLSRVIGATRQETDELHERLQERYRPVLRDAHGLGGEER